MTVTSQQRGLPSCHGIRDRPSGLLPSDLDRPLGSLVTGMLADPNARATSSLRAWCIIIIIIIIIIIVIKERFNVAFSK